MTAANESVAPASAQSAVLMRSEPIPEGTRQAGGPIFDTQDPNDLGALMASMETIGFQGTSVAEAVRIIEKMVRLARTRLMHSELGAYPMILRTMQQTTKVRICPWTTRSTHATSAARSYSAILPT